MADGRFLTALVDGAEVSMTPSRHDASLAVSTVFQMLFVVTCFTHLLKPILVPTGRTADDLPAKVS